MDKNKPIGRMFSEMMRRIAPPHPIRFILWVAAMAMLLFSIIRIVLLCRNLDMLNSGIDNTPPYVLHALWMGVRFDISFVTKILALPTLLLALGILSKRLNRILAPISIWFTAIIVSAALIIAISNIPYYEYCDSHLNALAISYITTDTGQTFEMLTGEISYIVCAVICIATTVAFTLFVLRLARHYNLRSYDNAPRLRTAAYAILMLGGLPLTARGMAFQPQPLTTADAIISNNNFLNQLAINPVEPFIITIFEGTSNGIELMDPKDAYNYVCTDLKRDNTFTEHVEAKPSPWRNVVIIVQEGNSAERLAREGNTQNLLPNLDRLIEEGLYFENAYSNSTHTSYGIYAIVASMPPYMHLHPLKDGYQHDMNTIFAQLHRDEGMKTLFFVTHRRDFDNVNGFVAMQGFERLIAEDDYGVETSKTWGVDDHILYDRALMEIDNAWSEGRDVATVLLTCSNHRPFDAPDVEGFTPSSTDAEERAIEYADWAMNRFIDMAREREWFDETLFVITADHGRSFNENYIMNECIFHIPLLFYSPKHIAPEVRSDIVAQVDITPTAVSMLGKEYDNHTLGIDLTTQSRKYAVSTSVGHIACRNNRWLYAFDVYNSIEYLYDLEAEGDETLINVATEHPELVEEMHRHATATIQAGWDIHNTPTRREND